MYAYFCYRVDEPEARYSPATFVDVFCRILPINLSVLRMAALERSFKGDDRVLEYRLLVWFTMRLVFPVGRFDVEGVSPRVSLDVQEDAVKALLLK